MSAFKAALRVTPVSVAFAVANDFYYYNSGLFTGEGDSGCADAINHGMTAVGLGVTDAGEEYTIIRNSWGTNWGDAGYFKAKLDAVNDTDGGVCQLYKWTNYPLV